mgnify:CR=1 FL=1
MKKITDTDRLEYLFSNADFLMDWAYGEPYGIKMNKDPRKAIDAAILATRREGVGK